MRRRLFPTSPFKRASQRAIKKNPHLAEDIEKTLKLLSEDAFTPKLKTHKLKGKLVGSWACSAGYDLRITFKFVHYEGAEAILLGPVGTHDEVY